MPAFDDSEQAQRLIKEFFCRVVAQDDRIFAGSGLIVGFMLHDPAVRIVLDASKPPQPGKAWDVYVNDPAAPEPKVDISLSADDSIGCIGAKCKAWPCS